MTQGTRDEEATIVVRRPLASWRDATRSYVVNVDGQSMGKVKPGREVTVRVPPGRHRIRAQIDWTGSPEIDVELLAGENAVLLVEPAGTAMRLDQLFGTERYLRLTRVK